MSARELRHLSLHGCVDLDLGSCVGEVGHGGPDPRTVPACWRERLANVVEPTGDESTGVTGRTEQGDTHVAGFRERLMQTGGTQ